MLLRGDGFVAVAEVGGLVAMARRMWPARAGSSASAASRAPRVNQF
jgi:hypothetical protein